MPCVEAPVVDSRPRCRGDTGDESAMNPIRSDERAWSAGPLPYWIDNEHKIVVVGKTWDLFASENDAPHLTAAYVIGQPLWIFISDETTRVLYDALIRRAVDGRAVRFSLRCDSPSKRRRLEMEMCTESGFVRFQTHLVAAEPRDTVLAWSPRPASHGRTIRVCGWCNRVESSEGWVEVEDAIRIDALFEWAPPAAVYVTCRQCLEMLEEEVLGRG